MTDDENLGDATTPVCDQRAAHEERYLFVNPRNRSRSRQVEETKAEKDKMEGHRRKSKLQPQQRGINYARSPSGEAPTAAPARGSSRAGLRQELQEGRNDEAELLHVLMTRPQIASRPRDNIVFEGDMDLRTTFETSYEALARMRLEHWKRDQVEQSEREHDVSERAGAANGGDGGHAVSRGRRSVRASGGGDDDDGDHDRDRATPTSGGHAQGVKLTRARMIRSPARLRGGDSLVGTGLALGQLQHHSQLPRDDGPSSPAVAAGRGPQAAGTASSPAPSQASQFRKQHHQSDAAKPFVDPDLSPIIVYDANLNRLERVGLRKRSKYRPSTSLRPGGRGFFGQPADSNEQEQEQERADADCKHALHKRGEYHDCGELEYTPQEARREYKH